MNIETLYSEYKPKLKHYFYAHVHRDEVEDLVSDTFERILKYIHTLRDTEKINGWVFRIARNVMLEFFRHRGIRKKGDTYYNSLFPTSYTLEPKEHNPMLQPALDNLRRFEREILNLRVNYDMSPGQVATHLGINKRYESKVYSDVRKKLRSQLGGIT